MSILDTRLNSLKFDHTRSKSKKTLEYYWTANTFKNQFEMRKKSLFSNPFEVKQDHEVEAGVL